MSRRIEFMGGCRIEEAARQLVMAAAEHGSAVGAFNDIDLVATAESTAEDIVADYDAQRYARAEAFRKSPEGIATARAAEQRRTDLQQQHDALMRDLPSLDFKDEVAVLDWLCAMQGPSDHIGVIKRSDTIVATFRHHGFEPGVNCGADFRKGDRDNEFRWLVGQALDTLETCAIHGIIPKFAAEWKGKFAREMAP